MRVDCCKLDYLNWTLNLSVEFLEKTLGLSNAIQCHQLTITEIVTSQRLYNPFFGKRMTTNV